MLEALRARLSQAKKRGLVGQRRETARQRMFIRSIITSPNEYISSCLDVIYLASSIHVRVCHRKYTTIAPGILASGQ